MGKSKLSEFHFLAVVCCCCLGTSRAANLFSADTANMHVWIKRHGKKVRGALSKGRRIDPYGPFVLLADLLDEAKFQRAHKVVDAKVKGNKNPPLPTRKYLDKTAVEDFRLYVLPRMMGREPTYYDIVRRMRLASYDLEEGVDFLADKEPLSDSERVRARALINQRLKMSSEDIDHIMSSYNTLATSREGRKAFDLTNSDFLNSVARKDAGALSPEEYWMVHEGRHDLARQGLGYEVSKDTYDQDHAIMAMAEDVAKARALLIKQIPRHDYLISKLGVNHIEGKPFGADPTSEVQIPEKEPELDGSSLGTVLGDAIEEKKRGPSALEIKQRNAKRAKTKARAVPGTSATPNDPKAPGSIRDNEAAVMQQAAMVQGVAPPPPPKRTSKPTAPPPRAKQTQKTKPKTPPHPPKPRKTSNDGLVPIVIDDSVDLFAHPFETLQDASHYGDKPWNRVEVFGGVDAGYPPEPIVWFTCFEYYRAAGVMRTVKEAWNVFRAKNMHPVVLGLEFSQVLEIAALWRWRERAEAWDMYQVHTERLTFEQERTRAIASQVAQMKMWDVITSNALSHMMKKFLEEGTKNPEVTFNELTKMILASSKMKEDFYGQFGEDIHRTPLRVPSLRLSGDSQEGVENYTSEHLDHVAQILGDLGILSDMLPDDVMKRYITASQKVQEEMDATGEEIDTPEPLTPEEIESLSPEEIAALEEEG